MFAWHFQSQWLQTSHLTLLSPVSSTVDGLPISALSSVEFPLSKSWFCFHYQRAVWLVGKCMAIVSLVFFFPTVLYFLKNSELRRLKPLLHSFAQWPSHPLFWQFYSWNPNCWTDSENFACDSYFCHLFWSSYTINNFSAKFANSSAAPPVNVSLLTLSGLDIWRIPWEHERFNEINQRGSRWLSALFLTFGDNDALSFPQFR